MLLNAFAVDYDIIVFIFNFFSQSVNPNSAHMNFSYLMIGTIMIFAMAYYYLYARKVYNGSMVEIAPHQMS